jgi:hypothetical protein
MRAISSVFAILLLTPLNDAFAQQEIQVGSQVRISAPECGLQGHTGVFGGVEGDTLLFSFGSSTARCLSESVTRLDRRVESKSKALEGGLIGLIVGGVGGAAIGAATYQECIPEGWLDCMFAPESAGEQAALGAVVGGVLGAGIGALAGALRKGNGWERIPIHRIATTVNPHLNRVTVRFTVGF